MTRLRLLLIAAILITLGCSPKNKLDCSQWYVGAYELIDSERNILIERSETVQEETDRNTGTFTRFLVKWVDDCTYRLYFKEGEERFLEVWRDNYLEVTITGPIEGGYAYQARFSESNKVENYEIKRVQ